MAIEIQEIDEFRDTYIRVGCYRETSRLDRVLRTFNKAVTLARRDGRDAELLGALEELHDAKGILTVTWRSELSGRPLLRYVERAWEDENECCINHRDAVDVFDEKVLVGASS